MVDIGSSSVASASTSDYQRKMDIVIKLFNFGPCSGPDWLNSSPYMCKMNIGDAWSDLCLCMAYIPLGSGGKKIVHSLIVSSTALARNEPPHSGRYERAVPYTSLITG
jgi:hypothetical protein